MASHSDRFLFAVDGLEAKLRVARLSGREALSELFRFEIVLCSDEPSLGFDDVIGRTAVLTLGAGGDAPRHVHGMICRFRMGEPGDRITTYHATLVPKVWTLLHRRDCRIFQEQSVEDILDEVLSGAGIASGGFRFALDGSYDERDYCVQYRESDWAFACRLMEEEGLYYFFEHKEDEHVLVIADGTGREAIAGERRVPFRARAGALAHGDHVTLFHGVAELRSGKVTLRDFDFEKPSRLLEGSASADRWDDLEIYDHPGSWEPAGSGDARARVRLEERRARARTGEGEGTCDRFTPGHAFSLVDHGREAFNGDWLLTRVDHQGADTGAAGGADEVRYDNRFECIPADVPFRPPLATPRPTVKGVQSAIVVGPSGEEIYTDKHGRVKVHFHWDRLGNKDEKSSCWIRVSQAWAGEAWGSMHVPRIGQEVLVDFLDGDPDRPIVTGRVYHGANVPPYKLPDDKTKSGIKSRSTPDGDGSNELRFEDKKDEEEVYLHAQKDLVVSVENDRTETIGNDASLEVKNDRKKKVERDETENIDRDRTIEVGRDHTETIGRHLTITVKKTKTEEVEDDSTETVTGKKTLEVEDDYDVDVDGSISIKVGSDMTEDVELERTIKAGSKIKIECGDVVITIEDDDVTVEGKDITVKSSGDTKVEAEGDVSVAADGDVKVEADGDVSIEASGDVKIAADGDVTIDSSGDTKITADGDCKVKGSNVKLN